MSQPLTSPFRVEGELRQVAANGNLNALVNAVEAQRGKTISEDDADDLIAAALDIIALLLGE